MTTFVHNGKTIKEINRPIFRKAFEKIFVGFRRYMIVQSDGTRISDGKWEIKITVLSMKEIKQKYLTTASTGSGSNPTS